MRRSASRHLLGICGARCPIALPCMHSMTPFLTFLQLCLCSSGHQERARASSDEVDGSVDFSRSARTCGKSAAHSRRRTGKSCFCNGSRRAVRCRCLLRCGGMRRGGVRLRQPDDKSQRRACSWDTGSRRPYRCRALACAHCCTLHARGDVGTTTACWAGGVGGSARGVRCVVSREWRLEDRFRRSHIVRRT